MLTKRTLSLLSTVAISSQILSGCMVTELKKNMDEMHNATVSMNDKMDSTNAGMNATNEALRHACMAQVQGESKNSRRAGLEEIESSKSMGKKLAAAVAYNFAFEQQVQKSECYQFPEYIATVKDFMVREFLESIQEYVGDMSKISTLGMGNKVDSLHAILLTLHYVNPVQQQLAKTHNFTAQSMLDLLADGIAAEASINANEVSTYDIAPHAKSVRKLIEEVRYLLKERYDFLPAFSYTLMTTHPSGNILSKAELLMRMGKVELAEFIANHKLLSWIKLDGKWVPNLERKNATQIAYYAEILERAVETRNIIEKIDSSIETNKPFYDFFKNMDLTGFDSIVKDGDTQSIRDTKLAIERLKVATAEFLKAKDMQKKKK